MSREIPYYSDYVSENFQAYLEKEGKPFEGVRGLVHVGESGGLESKESLQFTCDLYDKVKERLNNVLNQRAIDRKFIDERVSSYYKLNQEFQNDLNSLEYQTVLGDEDSEGRIVIGPKLQNYCGKSEGEKIAPIPDYLQGFHVTLFGPPDDAKLSVNAMNAYHRKLKEEPAIVEEILKTNKDIPKWGADDEDSKTPLRSDLISASVNLTGCLNETISFHDEKRNKSYELASDNLSYPIKRFPGLALPTAFMFYNGNPLPLHLYDFAIHLYEHYKNPKALTFYVPKLENEEEAAYIKFMIETAEKMIQEKHADYKIGTVRVIIVLENPRAVFRVNEIMDELYPYFVGASLGWHDYLGSTARLLKEDGNYRIPVKADPDIVIKYIKASHELLANVVGERGGIKIGGMYGILPIDNDLFSDSFQITIRGFFRDVLTQMKRDLSGYWVAHPDFIRIGIAIVEAWRIYKEGDDSKLKGIIDGLLNEKYAKEIWDFVHAKDIESLDLNSDLYARSLIVADIKESTFIANNHPDEIRYNVFQMLQYLTDWLSGNGCVALPTQINGIPARVMDDLATAERSRWEVWHEIHHGRFKVEEFIKIAHEEMNFIRRDLSDDKKIVQIKYTEENAKWYDIAFKLMLKLMTDKNPVEFATELLIPFTIDSIRNAEKPWSKITEVDAKKFEIDSYVEKYNFYFEMCGAHKFARENVGNISPDLETIENSIMAFSKPDIISAASFHGDIGQAAKTLDAMAKAEQEKVSESSNEIKDKLLTLGEEYLAKFGVKFLVSARGKSADELLSILEARINNSEKEELENAKKALFEITKKRILVHASDLKNKLDVIFSDSKVPCAQVAISTKAGIQQFDFGEKVSKESRFQIASLSKTFAVAFAHEFLFSKGISPESPVNQLLEEYGSDFRLSAEHLDWSDRVLVKHLMSHSALNMHYVNGIPSNEDMPKIDEFLTGNEKYDYEPVKVVSEPGKEFKYSGAGFIVLEYLIELIGKDSIDSLSKEFFNKLELSHLNFNQKVTSNYIGEYKMFPAFAAGMWATTSDVLSFLSHIGKAYHSLEGSGGISHITATRMVHGTDKGCKKFMNALMGEGLFIVEADDNKWLLHQGANDGYRAIYLYCFKGDDLGKGLCITCNADLEGVVLNAKLTQLILKELEVGGVDFSKFNESFKTEGLSSEEIVNIGYKNLVLDAFMPTKPEAIQGRNEKSKAFEFNLACSAKIINVSNDRFARAENLISPYRPVFDPTEFGVQGKIMDSWETARHNYEEYDSLTLVFNKPEQISYVSLSTMYHDGNQVEWVELYADGKLMLKKTQLFGHSLRKIKLEKSFENIKEVEVRAYPDGGLSRLGLYSNDLPGEFAETFTGESKRYEEVIPHPTKPLGIDPYSFTGQEVGRANYASLALGAKVLSATDEHYAPAINVISPFVPLNMFDGLESKRSRVEGHKEQVVIELAKEIKIGVIHFDFTYFVNNNPLALSVEYLDGDEWKEFVTRYPCKAFAANKLELEVKKNITAKQLRFSFYPDGGVNRIKVFKK